MVHQFAKILRVSKYTNKYYMLISTLEVTHDEKWGINKLTHKVNVNGELQATRH